jgi:hypothetical protein
VALHAQAQRLKTLKKEERVERCNGCANVAKVLQASLQYVAGRKQWLGQFREDKSVVTGIGRGESGETAARFVVEVPTVDDDATN